MSSIVTAVFKATFGVLVNKARDKAAEKLKEGDVTDIRIRDLIAREIDDIKSKLEGLSRKDLLAAIDAFETGLTYCYQAMDAQTVATTTELSSASSTAAVNTAALAAGVQNMELIEFGEKVKRALYQGKERFKMAREEATRAFNNETLSTSDRITAIQYRVMATMLESAAEIMPTARNSSSLNDVLEDAMPECKKCLQKLHSLPDVQSNFKVALNKRFLNIKGRFGRDERSEIISAVCHVNRAIYNALQAACEYTQMWTLPSVDTGRAKIDPLRNDMVAKALQKVGMEQCSLIRLFGQEGKDEHKLKSPWGIASNANRELIVADDGDKTVKVFGSSGHFILQFILHTDDGETKLDDFYDVATDKESNIYALVELKETGTKRETTKRTGHVLVFNSTGGQLRKFPTKRSRYWGRLTVNKNNVLVARYGVIYVYDLAGGYVRSIGDGLLRDAVDITCGADGRVLVLDNVDSCIHIFSEDGQQLNKFSIETEEDRYYRIACHPGGEHVILAGEERETGRLLVAIYTKDGESQRTVKLHQKTPFFHGVGGITVSMEGSIFVPFVDENEKGKVIVL